MLYKNNKEIHNFCGTGEETVIFTVKFLDKL